MNKILCGFFATAGSLHIALAAPPASKSFDDILPASIENSSRVCQMLLSDPSLTELKIGDFAIARLDVGYLLKDRRLDESDRNFFLDPGNWLRARFTEKGPLTLLATRSRVFGSPGDLQAEFLYLLHASEEGSTEFSTARRYSFEVGQKELGTWDLNLLKVFIDFRSQLLSEGQSTPAFKTFISARIPSDLSQVQTTYSDLGADEGKLPLESRIRLADARIEEMRQLLSPLIRQDHWIRGNVTTLRVTQKAGDYSQPFSGKIHQIPYQAIPQRLQVAIGDIVVVEAIRPGEFVAGGYEHKFNIPEVAGVGLLPLYKQTLEQAQLTNDLGPNRQKFYFLADTVTDAVIRIGQPKIASPHIPHQPTNWVSTVDVKVTLPEGGQD